MTKAKRPRTGEPRQVKQPLKIDKLPEDVRDAILDLRNAKGKTWEQIEELSALPKDKGGFMDWESLPLPVLELFPDMKLPHSSLHRWYDLRVSQVRRQVMAESEKARAFAAAFAGKNLAEGNAAVMNAMRDQVFALMRQVGPGDQAKFIEGLNSLSLTMARLQRVDLQAKRVKVDQRRIKLLEKREQTAREAVDQITKKAGAGQFDLAYINLLRERTFGLPPIAVQP